MSIRPRQSLLNSTLQRPSALSSVPRSTDLLWLDKNENLDPALMAVAESVLSSIPSIALATYPEAGDLYRKLAQWVGVAQEALLLTPGSDGAIRLVFEAFVALQRLESETKLINSKPNILEDSLRSTAINQQL